MSKTGIWEAVCKTDPAHTKAFSRAGGFKGTAVKPQWVVSRLTEEFGPVGEGWGMGEPLFQVVAAGNETLVYCTVSAWHTDRANVFWGVGGDKVTTARQSGQFNDDEAFKKAFTDALMNAFKFVGVAADVHMGRFDDNKYVQDMKDEFRPRTISKQEDTHGPDWPNLTNPSSITSNAARKDDKLVAASIDVKSRLDFASTVPVLESLIEEVTPTVAQFPETWRRVLWGEYAAVLADLKAAA
jgi:hypothetical protein